MQVGKTQRARRVTRQRHALVLATIGMLLALLPPSFSTVGATSTTIDPRVDAAINATWARSDAPVAAGVVARTWMWGPAPIAAPLQEPYAEAPGGVRTVVYYDKSRMEVTHPDGDATSPWYVTNGLLAQELILGEMQVGDNAWEPRLPAEINIAGDQGFPNGPTYATFHGFALSGFAPRERDLLDQRIDRAGRVVPDARFAAYGVRALAGMMPPSERTIAAPFWEFIQSRGLVQVDGRVYEDTLFPEPAYVTGVPITEPYWAEIVVGGTQRDVLLQCFERRCLTYTPSNPPGWQVESGNIGQHYQQWRYAEIPDAPGEILITRYEEGCGRFYLINADGSNERRLDADIGCQLQEALWSPDGMQVLFSSDADLHVLRMATMEVIRLTDTPGVQERGAVWSPDSRWVAAERVGNGPVHIVLLAADGSQERPIASVYPDATNSGSRDPSWSPDGQWLAFMAFKLNAPDAPGVKVGVVRSDGRDARELWSFVEGNVFGTVWAPDGHSVVAAYDQERPSRGSVLLALDLVPASEQPRLISGCLQDAAAWRCVQDATAWGAYGLTPSPLNDGEVGALASSILVAPDVDDGLVIGTHGVHIINVVTGEVSQLTHFGYQPPCWSPDGEYLTFAQQVAGAEQHTVMVAAASRDGAQQWVVTTNGHNPQWRPTPVTSP